MKNREHTVMNEAGGPSDHTLKKVLQDGRIENDNEYKIIAALYWDLANLITDDERHLLGMYMTDYEQKRT